MDQTGGRGRKSRPFSARPQRCGRNNRKEMEPHEKVKLREENIVIGNFLWNSLPLLSTLMDARDTENYTSGGHEIAQIHPYMLIAPAISVTPFLHFDGETRESLLRSVMCPPSLLPVSSSFPSVRGVGYIVVQSFQIVGCVCRGRITRSQPSRLAHESCLLLFNLHSPP